MIINSHANNGYQPSPARPSIPSRNQRTDNHLKSLKSHLVQARDHPNDHIIEHNPQKGPMKIIEHQAPSKTWEKQNSFSYRIHTQGSYQNSSLQRNSSVQSNGVRNGEPRGLNSFDRSITPHKQINNRTALESYPSPSGERSYQFRNSVGNHSQFNVAHNLMGSHENNPKLIKQNHMNQRIHRPEPQVTSQHQQFLKKCLEVQKLKFQISQLESQKQVLKIEAERAYKQTQNLKENNNLKSKMLTESRATIIELEGYKKKLECTLNDERVKYDLIDREKKALEKQIDNFKKVKEYMCELEQAEEDQAKEIKNNIAYELRFIQLNQEAQNNLELSSGDLKQAQQIHHSVTQDIQQLEREIGQRIKDILLSKAAIQKELQEAKQETQKVRKAAFNHYQEKLNELQDQILALKEENMVLTESSESKILIIKLQRQINVLEMTNEELRSRNKENEENIEKMKNQVEAMNGVSKQSKKQEFYDRDGRGNLQSIIANYESRNNDLEMRIKERQLNQQHLKDKLQELQQEYYQLKESLHLKNRQQRSITQSSKNQLETLKLQMKNQIQSLTHKISSQQENIKRKGRQIREKDEFITKYLISRVKDETDAMKIMEGISIYFDSKNEVQ